MGAIGGQAPPGPVGPEELPVVDSSVRIRSVPKPGLSVVFAENVETAQQSVLAFENGEFEQ